MKIKGLRWEHEIVDSELKVYYKNSITTFGWPLVFDWSLTMLDWQIRERFGLLNRDARPPALYKCYGGLEVTS